MSEADKPAPWVELRVHGVSGTLPADTLLCDKVMVMPGGDDQSTFYRPADENGKEHQAVKGRTLEAFHWGKHTAGSTAQALWLLIIPFGIVNASQFMLPAPRNSNSSTGSARDWLARQAHAVAGAALRAIAVGLSCLAVFSTAVVALDIFAWQLGRSAEEGRAFLLPLALIVPVGVLMFLHRFGRGGTVRTGRDPALDADTDAARPPRKPLVGSGTSGLARTDFFTGDPDAPTLRRLHMAAILAMLAALVAWPMAQSSVDGASAVRNGAGLFAAFVLLIVVILGDPGESVSTSGAGKWVDRWHRAAGVLSWGVVGVAWAFLAAGICVARRRTLALPDAEVMPGIGEIAWLILVWSVFAILLLLFSVFVLAVSIGSFRPFTSDSAQEAFRPFARGNAASLAATVATFLAVGFTSAVVVAVTQMINWLTPFEVDVTPILYRVSYSWGLTIVLMLVMGLIYVVIKGASAKKFQRAAHRGFGDTSNTAQPYRRVATAMFHARMKNWIPQIFIIFAAAGVVFSLAAGIEQCNPSNFFPEFSCEQQDAWPAFGLISEAPGEAWELVAYAGTAALVGLAFLLILIGRGAIRSEKTRRAVNVVWDVIAFWPRSVHPFVPPPYSQLVVADLRRRISWHLGTLKADVTRSSPSGVNHRVAQQLVLAPHSQGSLISLAALLWLTEEERAMVGWVTYGSQIRVMFSKAFPAYVNVQVVHRIWDGFGERWCNLYRDTDPLAGPVLSWSHRTVEDGEPVPRSVKFGYSDQRTADYLEPLIGTRRCGNDWRLLDPPQQFVGQGAAALRAHSDYPADLAWDSAVLIARGQPPNPPTDPPKDQESHPM